MNRPLLGNRLSLVLYGEDKAAEIYFSGCAEATGVDLSAKEAASISAALINRRAARTRINARARAAAYL